MADRVSNLGYLARESGYDWIKKRLTVVLKMLFYLFIYFLFYFFFGGGGRQGCIGTASKQTARSFASVGCDL